MTFDTDGTSHRSGSHTIHATASRLENLVGSAQLRVLPLKPLHLRGLLGCEAGTLAAVDLRPTDPFAQRLRRDAHFWPRPIRSPPTATGTRTDPPRPSAPPEPSAPTKTCWNLT